MVKNPPANAEHIRDVGLFPGSGRPLEKEMETYSNILAWEIPWTEEPSPWGHKRVRHDLETQNNSDTLTLNAQTYTHTYLSTFNYFAMF